MNQKKLETFFQTRVIKIPKNTMDTMSLRNVEVKKPTNEPVAAHIASLPFRAANHHSPKKAPKKGPQIKPRGTGTTKPTTKPIFVPHTPYFDPPNAFVPFAGIQ